MQFMQGLGTDYFSIIDLILIVVGENIIIVSIIAKPLIVS
jgi:hypothetical protein